MEPDGIGLDGDDEELAAIGADERSQNVFADLE
jgi:hypothetical protein